MLEKNTTRNSVFGDKLNSSHIVSFFSQMIDKTGDEIIFSIKGRHKKSPGDKILISLPVVIVLWQNLFRHLSSSIINVLWRNILSLFWHIFCQQLSVSSQIVAKNDNINNIGEKKFVTHNGCLMMKFILSPIVIILSPF